MNLTMFRDGETIIEFARSHEKIIADEIYEIVERVRKHEQEGTEYRYLSFSVEAVAEGVGSLIISSYTEGMNTSRKRNGKSLV